MSGLTNLREHPVLVIEEIIDRYGHDLVFTYSRYEVGPPGQQAARRCSDPPLRVRARDVSREWLMDQLAQLGASEELAWHSYVDGLDRPVHIPMLDFVGRHDAAVLRGVGPSVGGQATADRGFFCFDTGRSYHGYGTELIPRDAWYRFLGNLLLLNQHDGAPLIDARWVGHALVRGFTALRWSHNTTRYLSLPRLVFRSTVAELTGGGR